MYVREKKVYLKYILKKKKKETIINAKLFNLYVYSVYVYIVRLVRVVGGRDTETDSSRASISKARSTMVQFCPFFIRYEIYFCTCFNLAAYSPSLSPIFQTKRREEREAKKKEK